MSELNLFDVPDQEPHDNARLMTQLEWVYAVMKDGEWRTLHWISSMTGAPQASVSAQLRHLRKERFGGHDVIRRRVEFDRSLYEYRLEVNGPLLDGKGERPPGIVCPTCGKRS